MQTTLDDQQALAELNLSRVRPFQLREYPGLIRLCSILLFLAIWEYYGRGVDPIFLSYPTAIARAAVQVTASGELGQQFLLSMKAFVIGFGSAIVLGIGVGLLMGRYRLAQYLLDPYMYAMDATPRVALIPLLLLWFGLGIWSKVAIVFLSGLFPILINTFSGVKTVSGSLGRSSGRSSPRRPSPSSWPASGSAWAGPWWGSSPPRCSPP
ncbi:MAG: ABC transporter permease subunit [Deltaproteobacteria bacterium]|nr:ABC transporter permease subunit [Deltaproteobacteria bacterium]